MNDKRILRTITASKNIEDVKGWTIPKNARIFVLKEGPEPPKGMDIKKMLVVRIDNGTGDLDLMPETAIYEPEVPK